MRMCGAIVLGVWLAPVRVAADAPAASAAAIPAVVNAQTTTKTPSASRLMIASETTCPSQSAVAEALAAMCPPAEWPSGSVRIQTVGDRLIVDLAFHESTRREVDVGADCGFRAGTVALLIATWAGKLSSDAAGMPILRGQAAGDRGALDAGRRSVSLPATERELGLGLLVAVSGGVAPGIAIDFVETRAPRGLGWQATLALPAQRERATAGGTTGWTRATASIGLNGRAPLGRWRLSVAAGFAGAFTITSGHGYAIEQGWEALTGGLVAGARLALPWHRLRLWTDVRAYKWLFPQTVAVDSQAGERVATVALPSWDLQGCVGVAYPFP
jgi:hypothetical protein